MQMCLPSKKFTLVLLATETCPSQRAEMFSFFFLLAIKCHYCLLWSNNSHTALVISKGDWCFCCLNANIIYFGWCFSIVAVWMFFFKSNTCHIHTICMWNFSFSLSCFSSHQVNICMDWRENWGRKASNNARKME